MPIDYTKRPGPAQEPPAGGGKISLTKSAPTVSLTKAATGGRLHVNLNWDARASSAQPRGLFSKMTGAATGGGSLDLDLGCLYELANGRKGVVQALGNSFGSLDTEPYVFLDGDDRSGAVSQGENLYVNLVQLSQIRRVLVFAMIYEGAASFEQAQGVVTLTPVSGPAIEVRLDGAGGRSRMCAIALLENAGGELVVRREVNYVQGTQAELDAAYGWGMRWQAGRK